MNLPSKCKVVGCKWIFKKKLRPDGRIEKYKVRLVAKEYTRKKGINYFDTYSLVRISTIRVLVLSYIHKMIIHETNVKAAFLNGDLEEKIYMIHPEGFVVKGKRTKYVNLLSLFGDWNKLPNIPYIPPWLDLIIFIFFSI